MRPVIAYDVVRVCLAGVLLLAAALKGYQLATEPVLGTGLLDSRWFRFRHGERKERRRS